MSRIFDVYWGRMHSRDNDEKLAYEKDLEESRRQIKVLKKLYI
jgi:hypothetical protein